MAHLATATRFRNFFNFQDLHDCHPIKAWASELMELFDSVEPCMRSLRKSIYSLNKELSKASMLENHTFFNESLSYTV